MLSRKISVLNHEESSNFVKILNTKYASYLGDRSFELETYAEPDCAHVKVLLRNASDRFYYPVEAQLYFKEQDLSVKNAVLFLIDYIDFYFDEFFKENEDLYIPIDWSKHTFEDVEFFLKGQILNLERERMANELLGDSEV